MTPEQKEIVSSDRHRGPCLRHSTIGRGICHSQVVVGAGEMPRRSVILVSFKLNRQFSFFGIVLKITHARLSRITTVRTVAIGETYNCHVADASNTYVELWNSEAEYDFVRLIYANLQGGDEFAVAGAVIAPSATTDRGGQPVDEAGLQAHYDIVTFNNGGLDLSLEDQALGALYSNPEPITCIDFPALPGVAAGRVVWTPQLVFSDWMPLASTARRDGGPGNLLSIRTKIPYGKKLIGPRTIWHSGTDASDTASITGRSYSKYAIAGDFVTGAPEVPASEIQGGHFGHGVVYAVQFFTRFAGATVQAVGDSISQGSTFQNGSAVSAFASFAHIACAYASSSTRPVTLLQSAVTGQPSLDFYQSALNDLKHSDVAIALIQTWSGNDVSAAHTAAQATAAANAAWGRAMHYGELIRKRGGVPIFLSAVPQAPRMGSAGAEAARLSSVHRCAMLAKHGEITFDMNQFLGDGADIAGYSPFYGHADNIHPNTNAYRAIGYALGALIKSVLEPAQSAP